MKTKKKGLAAKIVNVITYLMSDPVAEEIAKDPKNASRYMTGNPAVWCGSSCTFAF